MGHVYSMATDPPGPWPTQYVSGQRHKPCVGAFHPTPGCILDMYSVPRIQQAESLSDLLERGSNVATFAEPAECFGMHIVFFMAIDTSLAQRRNPLPGARVAGHALHLLVRTVERKAGACVVIEIPGAPVASVMAIRTGRPQAALVHVVLGMAANTFFGRILELQALVASVALDCEMASCQRKSRACVVESGFFP